MGWLSYKLTPMAGDFDAKLTGLAAEILRDAVEVFDQDDVRRWLVSANVGMLGGLGVTGSFPAITGSFPAITGSFPVLTGAFPALTGALPAVGFGDNDNGGAGLKQVFKLPGKLAPIRLPSQGQLAKLARSSPIMAELVAFAKWLGRDGRPVNADDDLSDADAAAAACWLEIEPGYVSYLWDYAIATGWFELDDRDERSAGEGSGTRAMIGKTAWRWADGDDSGALHVWAAVFAAVLADTLDVAASMDQHAARKLRFQGQGVVAAVMIFLARRPGLSRAEVGELVMSGSIGDRPAARARRAWDDWVRRHGDPARWLLDELAALCAVSWPRGDDGSIELTPLALWALRTQFRLDGIEVPVLSAMPGQLKAAALVSVIDGVDDAELDAEFTPWAAARGPDRAARELLSFAAFSGPQPRLVAVSLVRRIGLDASAAWRDAMQRPELRGYARIALSALSADLPESALPAVIEPDPDDLARVAADLLALACGQDNPDPEQVAAQFSEAVPAGWEQWILDLMSRSPHPDVIQVLAALGRHHPDRWMAKIAKRAARAAGKNRAMARPHRVLARVGAR